MKQTKCHGPVIQTFNATITHKKNYQRKRVRKTVSLAEIKQISSATQKKPQFSNNVQLGDGENVQKKSMFSEIHKFFNCNPSDFFSRCLSLHVACDLSRPRPTTADKIGHSGARCPRWRHRAMLQLIKNDEKIITQWAFSKDTTPRRQHGLSPPGLCRAVNNNSGSASGAECPVRRRQVVTRGSFLTGCEGEIVGGMRRDSHMLHNFCRGE